VASNRNTNDKDVLLARGRLKEARRWFTYLRWEELPPTERGRRILKWGADHAWLASPANPQRSVRRWVRRWAPWLTASELDELVTACKRSNKRWSADQCATVLDIGMRHRSMLNLRFIGASDDLNYEARLGIKRTKAAARARRYRANHSTGAKRGRPAIQLSQEEAMARRRAQAAKRARRYRAATQAKSSVISKVASRKNASRHIIDIDSVTELSVTDLSDVSPATLAPCLPSYHSARTVNPCGVSLRSPFG
jgi:ribosomal protein L20A (L18A)